MPFGFKNTRQCKAEQQGERQTSARRAGAERCPADQPELFSLPLLAPPSPAAAQDGTRARAAAARMAEEPPTEVVAPEPVDDAPLRERVESKTWKTRMEAFVELEKVALASSCSSPAAVPADVAAKPSW